MDDKALNQSIERFVKDFPDRKYDIASHSLGSEIVMNGVEKYGFESQRVVMSNEQDVVDLIEPVEHHIRVLKECEPLGPKRSVR